MRDALSTHVVTTTPKDRRSADRDTTVLRIGVITGGARTTFCVLRNVSETGVQVKLYDPLSAGHPVVLRVGDGAPVSGKIVWVNKRHAGIKLDNPLDSAGLMRMREHLDLKRRRAIPRIRTVARAIVRSGGRTFGGQLHNISSVGAKLTAGRALADGESLRLCLPSLPELRAYVCWSEGETFGIRFQSPIPVEVLTEWLATRNRAEADESQSKVGGAPPAVGTGDAPSE